MGFIHRQNVLQESERKRQCQAYGGHALHFLCILQSY